MFHILVVEDFEPFRQFVCSKLQERAGFQISEASDGQEAALKPERLQPDLILLDIGLQKLNGIEVSRYARKVAPASKILFLSQESSSDVVREVLNIGAHGFLQKLHVSSDLIPAIDVVLKGGRFVSGGLVEPPSAETPVRELGAWKYPWQQEVMDVFESPRKSLPVKINMAERAIAGRLCDANLTNDERFALKRALWSLRVLLDEVKTRPVSTNHKRNTA